GIIFRSAQSDAGEAATSHDIQAGRPACLRAGERRLECVQALQPAEAPRRPPRGARATGFLVILGGALRRSIAGAIVWRKGRRDRQLLETLDDRQLRDIGVSRAMVEQDRNSPFWHLR